MATAASNGGVAAPVEQVARQGVGRLTEPGILFPAIAAVILAVVWTATIEFGRLQRTDAEHAAAVSARELLGTYEAQLVRAFGDIDQTLKLVKLWREGGHRESVLTELADKGLLPPDLIFTVSIANRDGVIVESTHADDSKDVSRADYFTAQRDKESFFISQPVRASDGSSLLRFSRRINTSDGTFDGAVIVAVDASYFTSGYDAAKLGERGLLAIVGTDDVVRIRRTGEEATSGERINYASIIADGDATDAAPKVLADSRDGVRRWTSARALYGFPVAVVVGLSVEEQLRAANAEMRTLEWRATLGSILVIALATLLGRQTWLLAQSRLRESQAKVAHAERVEYLAYHDGLTGLPNRSLFSRLLSQHIAASSVNGRPLAVALLDLDRFKQINDTLGHDAGDDLLKEVAKRLQECIRDIDTVARLGGDEFVVVMPDIDGEYATTVARKILALTARPFTLIGHEFRVTASIGISVYPEHGQDEQTLLKNADIAMYEAKAEGKNNFQFYSDKLNAHSLERLTFESSLRHALERNEFRLYYQAKREIETGRITGMEALLRWEHPDLGLVAPLRFIPIAEETGLTIPIGKWVLKTACAQNVAWQKAGMPPITVAVNLTSRQFFDERLLDDVAAVLASSGMDPHLLEFEIAESLLIQNIETTVRILTALRALGVRVAIDDFGTGYTTLSTLQRFPLDSIKIDRSFIHGLVGNPENTKLADAVIAMGKSLSLTIVAQGIETRAEAEFLRTRACDEIQGFYFNRPLPAEEFQRLLAAPDEITYIGRRLGSGHD